MNVVQSPEINSSENISYRVGNGHWEAMQQSELPLDNVFAAAAEWAAVLKDVPRPWLCWNIDPAWCLVQQKLISEVGWTPVVGFDPRVGPPPLVPHAMCIDFNKNFGLPTMWMHFPLELTFLISDRMAFWHSDLLIRRDKMRHLAELFAALRDGEMAATHPGRNWREWVYPRKQRYWELIGCNTRGSSQSQFDHGCGWWMDFWRHPSTPPAEFEARSRYEYDHGAGIRFWQRNYGGKVRLIENKYVDEGHCTRIGRAGYVAKSPVNWRRDLSRDLPANYDLSQVCRKLEIHDLLS